MKVLVVGSGGREHAIVHKLLESEKISKLYCAPGNGGISAEAECVNISATDIPALVAWAKKNDIDFTVVGMDDPLIMGIVDAFEAEGLRVFGPSKKAAAIEGSKAFAKELMKKYGIPTASYETFDNIEKAEEYIKTLTPPVVLKADGPALGKGVLICPTLEEALSGIREMMVDKRFGESGSKVVIEEYLTGPEVSVLSFCDGKTVVPMVSSMDHKRAKITKELSTMTRDLIRVVWVRFLPAEYTAKKRPKKLWRKYLYLPLMLSTKRVGHSRA